MLTPDNIQNNVCSFTANTWQTHKLFSAARNFSIKITHKFLTKPHNISGFCFIKTNRLNEFNQLFFSKFQNFLWSICNFIKRLRSFVYGFIGGLGTKDNAYKKSKRRCPNKLRLRRWITGLKTFHNLYNLLGRQKIHKTIIQQKKMTGIHKDKTDSLPFCTKTE